MDKFYEIVTGDPTGFYKICMALPATLDKVISDLGEKASPEDSAYKELEVMGSTLPNGIDGALYALGFSSYQGFGSVESELIDDL